MVQLIDKDALITEIARQKAQWRICKSSEAKYRREMLDDISSFLDTLEVKEVDLEKEIQDHIKECLDIKFPTTDIELIKKDVAYTAKKFFELGLKHRKESKYGTTRCY